MNLNITTENFCLLLKNGTEFWMNESEGIKISSDLLNPSCPQFLSIRGRPINKFEMIGVFTAQEISDNKHRKQGDWQCEKLNWHPKEESCDCWQYGK